jgi:hypothetical protein
VNFFWRGYGFDDDNDHGGDEEHDEYDEPPAKRLRFDSDDEEEASISHGHRSQSSANSGGQAARNVTVSDDNGAEEDDVEIVDPEREVFSNTSKLFLADSITGSPRHLKALARNAFTVVSELGALTVFITLTCNPKWPELQEGVYFQA